MEEQTSFNILIVCLNCVFTLNKDIYYYYYYYYYKRNKKTSPRLTESVGDYMYNKELCVSI